MACQIITLTTDFGSDSPYVAQVKASILTINPEVTIVDITHAIAPQNIEHAAIVLQDTLAHFPQGTIHVAVVDPGVGTTRPILVSQFGSQLVVSPDNGLLSGLAQTAEPTLLFQVTNRKLWNLSVSNTFHGRDIMAPVAAYLSQGINPAEVGPAVTFFHKLNWQQPIVRPQSITGTVVMIDSFGNLLTNIHSKCLPGIVHKKCAVQCLGHQSVGICATYRERPVGNFIALLGSSGRLELAIVCGDASKVLDAHTGDPVIISWE